jgi:uncharacterized protein with GYD domain
MPTYIGLANWTTEGMKTVKETIKRGQDAAALVGLLGGEIKATYWTPGPYDIIAIAEMPDEETLAKLSLAITSRGTTRFTAVRAFSEDEMVRILAQLPEPGSAS